MHPLGHEVPVGVAGQGQRAQHRERGVGVEGEEDGAFERGVVEQLVDEAGPALLERELRRDVVEHLDTRRQAGLHRVLGQDALGERVEGGHRGGVELLEREGRPGRGDGIGVACHRFQRPPDPVAQLGRRLLGERDRGDLAHGHVALDDQRDDPVDERLGLARTRARLDEQRLVERADDRGAGGEILVEVEERLLDGLLRHPGTSSRSSTSGSASDR